MSDFISFLNNQGMTGVDELTCFVHEFLDDPSIFLEMDQAEREEIERKMDEALNTFKMVQT
jgi:hypothetical protein